MGNIPTYEEVELMKPDPDHNRPLILAGGFKDPIRCINVSLLKLSVFNVPQIPKSVNINCDHHVNEKITSDECTVILD